MRSAVGLTSLRRLVLAVGVAFAGLPVGTALADTIGQVGGQSGFSERCGGVLADTNYAVQADGVINSFSIQTGPASGSALGNDGALVQFLVLRPAVGGTYTVIGNSNPEFLVGSGTQEFAPLQDISVQSGDILGLWIGAPPASDLCVRDSSPSPGGVVVSALQGGPAPIPGQPITLSVPAGGGLDLNEAANFSAGEGSPPPLTMDQCRNGGWRTAGQFKNQGDCISFVATRGKNLPSGS